ncbi:MAG: TetR/AcrR family transcriptional regulator [Candidatus Eremiobacteraeota bacterium]|nr:TetR/AcrR family transcriptional regulator [Candidatus Eremiobacteraeota bacterium]
MERRARQREEVRSQIVDAARDIVVNEGYHALTMRRIAEAVEYSPAAIYQYFQNRDAIAVAVTSEGFVQLLHAFAPSRSLDNPRARLEAIARAYVDFGLTNPQTYRLMFMEDPEITRALLAQPDRNDPGTQAYLAIVEPIALLAQQGAIDARDDASVRAIADTLWVTVHGIVSLKLTCPTFPETPVDVLIASAMRTFFEGILKR